MPVTTSYVNSRGLATPHTPLRGTLALFFLGQNLAPSRLFGPTSRARAELGGLFALIALLLALTGLDKIIPAWFNFQEEITKNVQLSCAAFHIQGGHSWFLGVQKVTMRSEYTGQSGTEWALI